MNNPPKQIPNVHFIPGEINPVEFDILRIEDLFDSEIDHPLETIHRIHFYNLFIIENGMGEHFIDFQIIRYKPRDILFVADKQVHQFTIQPNTKGYVVLFTKEFLYRTESEQSILQHYRLFDYSLKSPKISFTKEQFNHFRELFNQLFLEHDRTNNLDLQSEITHSLLKTILLKAEKEKRNQLSHREQDVNYLDFVKFRNSLEENFNKTRNVLSYTRLIGMSSKKLNQLTKEIVNQTAKSFIDERVVIEIKRLLAHTNLSISEMCELVGFDEPTNLVKYFKKHSKQTPTHFRKNQQSL